MMEYAHTFLAAQSLFYKNSSINGGIIGVVEEAFST